MENVYYELTTAPDFTLSRYSALSETGPAGVITQHSAFWRQVNQWGKLFGGAIHFIYEYDPQRQSGQRLKMVLCFDAPDREAAESVKHIMKASVLAPYYLELKQTDERCLNLQSYPWQINLLKQERFINSDFNDNEKFYTVSEWTMSQGARLYSLLKMMEVMNLPAAYMVSMYPVDYCDHLENGLAYILPHLRELNSFKVKTGANSVSSGGKDEGAKKALDFYEDLMDNMSNSPHFLTNIKALGRTEAEAKQLLDAAASEALGEGNHLLFGEQFGGTIFDSMSQGYTSWSDPDAAEALAFLPHLMTLEELVPYAVMPVLYPGEDFEMLKETVPPPTDGLMLGKDQLQHDIEVRWKDLAKHSFLAGMPGSGKTNTMMYLISEMRKAKIPVLVLEPAKKEYRSLTIREEMKDVSLFSPSANSMFPIHINPFEFPVGMKLADHINRLLDVFTGTFQLDPPFPMLLTEGIQSCYEELLWLPGMINTGDLEYPTMSMLYETIEKLLEKYEYAPDVKSNLKSVLQVRIGSLLMREMGDIFDVKRSTYRPEEWMKKSAIIELASLGTGPSNFLMLMLMTLIREALDVEVYVPGEDHKPRHMIFLEEAHNLIANTSDQAEGGLDPKVSATAFIVKMLAEVRALGEGIVIADQLPTAMAPEVVKNTSLKVGLRLTSQDERELLGSTMSADAVQLERMGQFNPGECLVSYEGLLKPFQMRFPEFKGDDAINDKALLRAALGNPNYQENLQKSAEIMFDKMDEKRAELKKATIKLEKAATDYQQFLKANEEALRHQVDEATPSTLTKTLLQKKRFVQKEFDRLVPEWCRLNMDIMLYLGVTQVRRSVASMITWNSESERKATNLAHNQWLDVIHPLYKQIQGERKRLLENGKDWKLQTDAADLVAKNMLRQQDLIMESWKRQI